MAKSSIAADHPGLTHVPPELVPVITGLPPKRRFLADQIASDGVAEWIEYDRGRWYVCHSDRPAQPIGLRLCPRPGPRSRSAA
jgi:hypothetical protein